MDFPHPIRTVVVVFLFYGPLGFRLAVVALDPLRLEEYVLALEGLGGYRLWAPRLALRFGRC